MKMAAVTETTFSVNRALTLGDLREIVQQTTYKSAEARVTVRVDDDPRDRITTTTVKITGARDDTVE